jgi:hypothetical protein
VRAIEASTRLKQLLREREVQLGDGDYATETALLAWELFCTAASEPADTPFEDYGAMTRVSDNEDADLLLFEAGAYRPTAPRYGLSFSRQFSLESDDDYVGMNEMGLAIDFDGDDLDAWPADQLWGYAGRRRHDVSDVHHPGIANCGWIRVFVGTAAAKQARVPGLRAATASAHHRLAVRYLRPRSPGLISMPRDVLAVTPACQDLGSVSRTTRDDADDELCSRAAGRDRRSERRARTVSTCQAPLRHHVLRCHRVDGP